MIEMKRCGGRSGTAGALLAPYIVRLELIERSERLEVQVFRFGFPLFPEDLNFERFY
jgi:hypothetical protein